MAAASSSVTTKRKVCVIGSTGATGKHVVRMLLDRGDTTVVALTRSKDRLLCLLNLKGDDKKADDLIVQEASISDMTVGEVEDLTEGCSAIVSCLGHNINLGGLFREGYWVSEAVEKVTSAMPADSRYILMGSNGVAHPDGATDPLRTRFERGALGLMRWSVQPVKDNELSALHLYQNVKKDWSIVRPGDLFNKEEDDVYGKDANQTDYEIFDSTVGSLFGGGCSVARSDVARFMAKLATMETIEFQKTFNHKMPVIYQPSKEKKQSPTEKLTEK